MSTYNVELTVEAAQNNQGIIAANNHGHQHNHYHGYDAEEAEAATSIRIRDHFFLSDPVIDRQVLQAAKGKRVPGTLEWIYNNDVYNAWLSGDCLGLWITGSPGKGKTMLAMHLTLQLETGLIPRSANNSRSLSQSESADKGPIRPVYAFFCRSDDEKRNSAVAVLRGMIYQILSNEPTLANIISKDMEGEKKSRSTLTSKEALWLVLEKLITNVSAPVSYCILDGLDECDQDSITFLRRKILGLCGAGRDSTTAARLRWLIISRDVGDLHDFSRISLDHHHREVDQDIQRVVTYTFENMVSVIMDEECKARLMDGVLDGAGGTFLWAGYIAHELMQRKTKSEFIQTLHNLPKDLNALYDRMLRDIPQEDREMCAALLRWVTLALEPLDLVDLAEALEIRGTPETTALEELDVWIRKCGHILQVSDTKIGLVHQSAKDYLLETQAKDPDLAIFQVTTIDGHYVIASRCIGYLEKSKVSTYTVFDAPTWQGRMLNLSSQTALQRDRAKCAFFAYALDHWAQHVQLSSTKFSALATEYPSFFSNASGICTQSINCRQDHFRRFVPDDKHVMRIAIREGLLQWTKYIHAKRHFKDLRSPSYRMKWKKDAVMTAINWGYLDIVTWLLDIGCDVNTISYAESDFGLKRLPLVLHAFKCKRYDIVDLLVQRGALLYGKPVHPENVQRMRSHGYDTAENWLRVFIEHFMRYSQRASVLGAYEWTLHCIWSGKFSLVSQLKPASMQFPSRYKGDVGPSCVLEAALIGKVLDDSVHDIWQHLVEKAVLEDQLFRQMHGTAGHGHSTRKCNAPRLAIMEGNASALRTLLRHEFFIIALHSDRHTWSEAFKQHSSHPEIIPLLIDRGAATIDELLAAVIRLEYAIAETLLSKGFDPNAESHVYLQFVPLADWDVAPMTPLNYAERIQDDRMVALLQRFGAKR